MKYGTIIPLIGGMTVGNKMAVGHDPSVFLSYDAFAVNDGHARLNFSDVPFLTIDQETNQLGKSDHMTLENMGQLDFVSSVCPCAGLSTLNAGNRGADAPQNEWMYRTARYVLEQVRPRVFWGENAPALGTNAGKAVADNLYEIGKANGYSFTIVKTDTRLHGIPQRRMRTFYFFWDSPYTPKLNPYKVETPELTEYLSLANQDAPYSDAFLKKDFETNGFLKWMLSKPEYLEGYPGYKTITHFAKKEGLWDELIEFLEKHGTESEVKFTKHAKMKVLNGRNYWDSSPHMFFGRPWSQAIQGRVFQNAIHPNNERYLSVREHMHMMGLPDDYLLTDVKHAANITQNVPTCTARDWTFEVIKYLNGELRFANKDRDIFDNVKESAVEKAKVKAPLF